MDQRAMYAVIVLGGAGFGYWWFTKKKQTQSQQPQDQTAATVAEQYYSQPTIAVQSPPNQSIYVNQKQAMPLPYNT